MYKLVAPIAPPKTIKIKPIHLPNMNPDKIANGVRKPARNTQRAVAMIKIKERTNKFFLFNSKNNLYYF